MSRIYFHSPSDVTEVWGPERHAAASMVNNIGWMAFGDYFDSPENPDPAREIVLGNPYFMESGYTGKRFQEALRYHLIGLHGEDRNLLGPRGPVSGFVACLNTALAVGGRVMKFMARLHGQCEIHAYVEGPNRDWLADIIEEGRSTEMLRPDMGWESVAEMLRDRDDEPVVTSYSVTDSFPNSCMAKLGGMAMEEGDDESYYDLPDNERWAFAMKGLREVNKTYTVQLSPDGDENGKKAFDSYYFDCGTNCFELRRYALKLASERGRNKTGMV